MPAQAQAPMWKQAVGYQLTTHLESPDVDRQNQAMQMLITLASRQDKAIYLKPTAGPLLHIYKTSSEPSRRMMAVSALQWVDTPQANQKLLEYGLLETEANIRRAILHSVAGSRWSPTVALAASFNALRTHDAQLQARARLAEQRRSTGDQTLPPGSRR